MSSSDDDDGAYQAAPDGNVQSGHHQGKAKRTKKQKKHKKNKKRERNAAQEERLLAPNPRESVGNELMGNDRGHSIINFSMTDQPSIQRSSMMQHRFSTNKLAEIERGSKIRAGNDPDPTLKNKKWYILSCSFLCFSATFHCLFSISALEAAIEEEYSMKADTFAIFGTVSYAAAMLSAIIIPYFINKYDLYKIIIFAQCCVSIGQAITVGTVNYKDFFGSSDKIILFIGRGMVGFGLGIDSVSIQALTGLWFRGSPKQTFAFAIVGNAIEVGISTSLWLLVPIKNSTNDSLFWPLLVGLLWAVISIFAGFYMLHIENELAKTRSIHDKEAMRTDTNFCEAIGIINKSKNKWAVWGIIIIIMNLKCIADILFVESETAYSSIYGIGTLESDWVVSIPSILGLGFGAVLGWIIGKFEQLSMTLILATLFVTMGLFAIGANNTTVFNIFGNVYKSEDTLPKVLPWAAVTWYALGLEMFFITGFSSLFRVVPVQVMSVASSMAAITTYGASFVCSQVFGEIAKHASYSYAYVFIAALSLFGGFFWAILVHVVDGRNDRTLRKMAAKKKKSKKHKGSKHKHKKHKHDVM